MSCSSLLCLRGANAAPGLGERTFFRDSLVRLRLRTRYFDCPTVHFGTSRLAKRLASAGGIGRQAGFRLLCCTGRHALYRTRPRESFASSLIGTSVKRSRTTSVSLCQVRILASLVGGG